MSYYKPQPLLPSRSPNKYQYPVQRPVVPRPPQSQNFCVMFISMLKQNPQLMQVLRQRPDLLAMFRNRCGGFQIGAAIGANYRKRYPKPTYPRGRPNTLPPYPQPQPPQSGCGYGKRFDSCGCRCVPKDAITPQCIRNCTQCGVDQVFNWCVMQCVPANSKIKQCPPLDGSGADTPMY